MKGYFLAYVSDLVSDFCLLSSLLAKEPSKEEEKEAWHSPQPATNLLLTIPLPAYPRISSIPWIPPLFSQSAQTDPPTHHVSQENPRTLKSSWVRRVSPVRCQISNLAGPPPHKPAYSTWPSGSDCSSALTTCPQAGSLASLCFSFLMRKWGQ